MRFGSHHVISALDSEGRKHVLGIQLGATENAAAVKDLLPAPARFAHGSALSVCDTAAKALRAGIEEVFGSNHGAAAESMRAAWRLPQAEEGIVRIKKLAGMIECDHPAAAASLRRVGGDLYDQSSRRSSQPPPLPGNHEPHREPAVGRAEKDWQCLPLARR